MSGQRSKRHHWVPQAYLRSFAADRPRRRKIWVFRNDTGAPALKPIKKVAVQFYLYAPLGQDGQRDYSFEGKLASLEQFFGGPYWRWASESYPDLTLPALHKGLSLLTAVMYLRNPLILAQTKDMHRRIVSAISSYGILPDAFEFKGKTIELDKSSWPEYRDADDDAIKKMRLDQVGSAVWLAEILMEMRWAMLVTEKPVYITTDNPVIVVHPDLRFRGFRNKEAMVIFPLSSTRTLVMDNRHSEPDAQFYDGTQTTASQNGLLFRDSLKCMFSSRNPDLVCAEIVQNAEAMGFAQGDYDL